MISRFVSFVKVLARMLRMLVTIRKSFPLWLQVVLVVSCLPIPGPVDNAAQIFAVAVLLIKFRPQLRIAFRAAQAW